MTITTDIEEINKQETVPIHSEEDALQGIKNIFEEVLQPLKKEIDKEEARGHCHIMIHVLPSMEEWGLPAGQQSQVLRVTLTGYSEELSIRIQQAIAPVIEASGLT